MNYRDFSLLRHFSYQFLTEARGTQDDLISELRSEIDQLNNIVARMSEKCGFEEGKIWVA